MAIKVVEKILNTYTKEQIEDLYIKQNLTKKELADLLGIGLSSAVTVLKKFEITKSVEDIVAKRKSTCISKYGVDNPSKSQEVIDKITNHMLDKYGVKCYTASKEGIAKGKQTKQERYGDPYYNNQEKQRVTKYAKYKDPAYNNRDKYKSTMQKEYGVDNYFQLPEFIESNRKHQIINMNYDPRYLEVENDRDKSIEYLKDKNYSYFDIAKDFNLPYYTVQMWVTRLKLQDYINYKFDGKSHYEDEIIKFLNEIGITNIILNSQHILSDGKEIDIYLPDKKIGIEFNGTYWHSDLFKEKKYHFNKSLLAEELGIRLIHIYQYEWDNPEQQAKIKSMLRIACGCLLTKVYARQCEIRKISNKEAKPFNDINHLQRHRNADVTYGLFYKDELVQLMSFSKTKYNRNLKGENSWEIIRGCPASNNIVVGGVSKLFKHFIDDYKPASVFSYCDFNKFDGTGYEAIGMKSIGYSGPDMKYVINGQVVNRNPKKHKELEEMADMRIFGSGSKKYKLEISVL